MKRRTWIDGHDVCLRDTVIDGRTGEDVEVVRRFHVYGGYVYEWDARDPGIPGKQVCDRLAHMGSTLMCRQGDMWALLRRIRREYRRSYDWSRREERRLEDRL